MGEPFTLASPSVHPIVDVLERTSALLDAFRARCLPVMLICGAGAFLISLQLARHFGQFHGGNTPQRL